MNKNDNLVTIGLTLKLLRLKNGFTIRELAKMADIPYPYLSKIEHGKANPTLDVFDRIYFILNGSLCDVVLQSLMAESVSKAKFDLSQNKDFKALKERINKSEKNISKNLNKDDDNSDDNYFKENLKTPIIGGGNQNLLLSQ